MRTMFKAKLILLYLILAKAMLVAGQNVDIKVETGAFVNTSNNFVSHSFQRVYTIKNNLSSPFTGYVKIREKNGSSINVNLRVSNFDNTKVAIVFPNSQDITTTGIQFGNNIWDEVVFKLTNFIPNSDIIEITETVSTIYCLTGTGGVNETKFEASYSNTNIADFNNAVFSNIPDAQVTQILYPGEKAVATILNETPDFVIDASANVHVNPSDFYCVDNLPRHFEFDLRKSDNTKYSGAKLNNLHLIFMNQEQLFTIDKASIEIKKFSNLNPSIPITQWPTSAQLNYVDMNGNGVPLNRNSATDNSSDACLPQANKFNTLQYNIGELTENEFLHISFDIYNCQKSTSSNVIFNNLINQSNGVLFATCLDDCGTKYFFQIERNIPDRYYDGGNNGLLLVPEIKQSPIQMMPVVNSPNPVPDVDNFNIEFPTGYNGENAYKGRFGLGLIHNPKNAEVVIRLNSEEGLRYTGFDAINNNWSAGTYPHASNPSMENFHTSIRWINLLDQNRIWLPINPEGSVLTFGTQSSAYNQREFRFRLADIPNLPSNATASQIKDAFFAYLNSSNLYYSMEADCSGPNPKNWDIQFFLNPDNTCTSEYLYPVSRVGEVVRVNCPGCKVPGAAVSSGNMQRYNYGPYDFDNDRLPDLNETISSTHTLDEVLMHENMTDVDPLNNILTTSGSIGDEVQIDANFYLTYITNCSMSDNQGVIRNACSDNELKYKWAYLQVIMPRVNGEIAFDQNIISNSLQVIHYRNNIAYTIPSGDITMQFYSIPSGNNDIYYIKIFENYLESNGSLIDKYYKSFDRFTIKFRTKIIVNIPTSGFVAVNYKAYFSKDEETIASLLQENHTDLHNRSYADCFTDEKRGMKDLSLNPPVYPYNCNTENLQMICEDFLTKFFLIHLEIDKGYRGYPLTVDASCPKFINAGAYNNHFGNKNNPTGKNEYINEIRIPPLINSFNIVVPKGYIFDYLTIQQTIIDYPPYGYLFTEIRNNNNAYISATAQNSNINNFTIDREITISIPAGKLTFANAKYDPTYNSLLLRDLIIYGDEYHVFSLGIFFQPICDYLNLNNIASSDPEPIVNGVKLETTMSTNAQGNNNLINILDSDPVAWKFYSTHYANAPFYFEKLGAQGGKYPQQKTNRFVNKISLRKFDIPHPNQVNFPNQKFTYSGSLFFAIDASAIDDFFTEFNVSIAGNSIINWSVGGGSTNKEFGLYNIIDNYDPPEIVVTGLINMSNPICTNDIKEAIYNLIWGLNCSGSSLTLNDILTNGGCQKWEESISLDLGIVSLSKSSYSSIISASTSSQHVVFTATRSQVTNMKVIIKNDIPNLPISISRIYLSKNMVEFDINNYVVLNTNNDTEIEVSIPLQSFDNNGIFELETAGHNWYNQLHVEYNVQTPPCSVNIFNTTVGYIGSPFYSDTKCPLTGTVSIPSVVRHNGNLLTGLSQQYCINSTPVIISPVILGGTFINGASLLTQNSDGTFSFIPATLGGGTYTFTYQVNENGCISSDTKTIEIGNLSVDINITGNTASILCSSTTLLTLTATPKEGTPIFDYSWSGPSILGDAMNASVSINGVGSYTVTITDDNLCTGSKTLEVKNEFETICPGDICPGENPTLDVNVGGVIGTYAVQWYNQADPTNMIPASITQPGNYFALVVTPACTLQTDVCTIGFKRHPVAFNISPAGPSAICPGQTVELSVLNPGANDPLITDVVWSTGETSLNPVTVPTTTSPGLPANLIRPEEAEKGGYFIVAIDKGTGCRTISNRAVVYGPHTTINRSCYQDAFGTKVLLSAGSNIAAGAYKWYSAVTSPSYQETEITDQALLPAFSTGNNNLIVSTPGIYVVKNDLSQHCGTHWSVYENMLTTGSPNLNIISANDGSFANNGNPVLCSDPKGYTTDFTDCLDRTDYPSTDQTLTIGKTMTNYASYTANDWNPSSGQWSSVNSPGTSPTNYMIIDGVTQAVNKRIWYKENIPVQHNLYYLFKASLLNIDARSFATAKAIPEVKLRIMYKETVSGSKIGWEEPIQILYQNTNPQWLDISQFTLAGYGALFDNLPMEAKYVDLEIIMSGGGAVGRDLALDDVELIPVGVCDDINTVLVTSSTRACGANFVTIENSSKYTCKGVPVKLQAFQLGSNASLEFIWKDGNTAQVLNDGDGDPMTLTVSPDITTTYYFTVNDNVNQCTNTRAITVFVVTPVVHIVSDPSSANSCTNATLNFSVDRFAGVGNVSYQWFKNGIAVSGAIGNSYSPLSATLIDNDQIECKMSTLCTINGNANAQVVSNIINVKGQIYSATPAGADKTICKSSTIALGEPTVVGVTYSWSPTTYLDDATKATPVVSPTGNETSLTYSLTVTDINGCSKTDDVLVTVTPLPSAPTVSSPVVYCSGASASPLTATGINLSWYNALTGGASISTPTPSTVNAVTTSYYVSQTVNTCEGPRAKIDVVVNSTPSLVITNPSPVCSPSKVNLTLPAVTAGSSLSLSYSYFTNAAATNVYTTPAAAIAGTYYIKGTTAQNCFAVAPVTAVVNSLPAQPGTTHLAYCRDQTVNPLTATGAFTKKWYDAAGNVLLSPYKPPTNTAGTKIYYVSQIDGNGCESAKKSLIVNVSTQQSPKITMLPSSVSKCNGQIATVGVGFTEGQAPYNYIWNPQAYLSNPSGIGNNGSTNMIVYQDVYAVAVVGANNCTNIKAFTVNRSNCKMGFFEEDTRQAALTEISPNPTENNFNLKVYSEEYRSVEINVLDMNGKLIQLEKINTNEPYALGEGYGAGVYVLKIIFENNKIETHKLVKIK